MTIIMGVTKFIAFAVIVLHIPPVSCDHSTAAHTSFSVASKGGGAEKEPSSILNRALRIVPEEIIGISPLQVAIKTNNANKSSEPNSLVRAKTFIDLPFEASVGYDAFVDLPRQPSWSPFLQEVVFLDRKKINSRWTMNMLGVKFGWTAKFTTRNRWRKIIAWESTSGTWNTGSVQFIPLDAAAAANNNSKKEQFRQSRMLVEVKAEAPSAVAALFDKSTALQSFFENVLIKGALRGFRKVVHKEDISIHQKAT